MLPSAVLTGKPRKYTLSAARAKLADCVTRPGVYPRLSLIVLVFIVSIKVESTTDTDCGVSINRASDLPTLTRLFTRAVTTIDSSVEAASAPFSCATACAGASEHRAPIEPLSINILRLTEIRLTVTATVRPDLRSDPIIFNPLARLITAAPFAPRAQHFD